MRPMRPQVLLPVGCARSTCGPLVARDAVRAWQEIAAPVQFDETPPGPGRAPEHGQHTEEILLELGFDWDDIAKAKDGGAIL